MSAAPAPRPILKSASRKSSTSSCDSSVSSSSRHCVQFSQCLSTTYLTHGSNDYNRSPITVTPNSCAMPKRCQGDLASLTRFRLESEGRALPALVADEHDGSSSEESDIPPSPTYTPNPTPGYAIPASLLKSNSRSRSKPCRGHPVNYSIPRPTSCTPEYDGRDDIFGGF